MLLHDVNPSGRNYILYLIIYVKNKNKLKLLLIRMTCLLFFIIELRGPVMDKTQNFHKQREVKKATF